MVTRAARRIPLAVPVLGGREAEYVRECLESGWVSTAGPWVGRFERAVADYLGVRAAVATCNGTAALHVALLSVGVQPGDAVLVSDLTFIAPVNAIRYCGAEPIFIDVDRERWQMDPAELREFLAEETRRDAGECRDRRTGRRIRAILPVHLLGLPAPIDQIGALAEEFGLALVQDAAQGLGALSRGRKVGTLGGVTTFSFNGNKIVTCGAGGLVATNDEAAARQAQYLTTQAKDDPLYFRHDHVGFNYRLSSLHAALGLAQLERIDEFIAAKRAIFSRYRDALATRADLRWVEEAPGDRAIYWLASFTLAGGRARRDRVLRELIDAGIEARPPWQPNHLQQPYRNSRQGVIRQTLDIVDTGLHLPSSASLTPDDQAYVVDVLTQTLRE
jgi:perosamine synthetase